MFYNQVLSLGCLLWLRDIIYISLYNHWTVEKWYIGRFHILLIYLSSLQKPYVSFPSFLKDTGWHQKCGTRCSSNLLWSNFWYGQKLSFQLFSIDYETTCSFFLLNFLLFMKKIQDKSKLFIPRVPHANTEKELLVLTFSIYTRKQHVSFHALLFSACLITKIFKIFFHTNIKDFDQGERN